MKAISLLLLTLGLAACGSDNDTALTSNEFKKVIDNGTYFTGCLTEDDPGNPGSLYHYATTVVILDGVANVSEQEYAEAECTTELGTVQTFLDDVPIVYSDEFISGGVSSFSFEVDFGAGLQMFTVTFQFDGQTLVVPYEGAIPNDQLVANGVSLAEHFANFIANPTENGDILSKQ